MEDRFPSMDAASCPAARRRGQVGAARAVAPPGPKVKALRSRRQARPSSGNRGNRTAAVADTSICSDDGTVAFVLKPCGAALFVKRTQWRPLGTMTALSMRFPDSAAFGRWCDLEPVRFDYPLLFDRLRRRGDEVFAGEQ